MAELWKYLPIAIVEQYRRESYARYAINSMEDIELHEAAVAMRVKVMLRGWLLFRKIESIVIMYLISIMIHTTWKQICTTSTIFVCALVYKIKAYAKIEHWERNYLISNWRGRKETK